MKTRRLIIGSRSSKLAMAQTQYVMDRMKKFYPAWDFKIKTIKTAGDKIPDVSLSKIGDKGLFTKEIEEALLRREVDIAVHSMKDLPTKLPQDLKIAAVTEREDLRDVLVSKEGFTIKTLPKNSKIGTSSLRRRAQLLHMRKDLDILNLRGNLDTRLKKLEKGLYNAIIVAYAGIKRMGFAIYPRTKCNVARPKNTIGAEVNLSAISTEDILPQAGQGALGIEIHKDRREVNDLVKALDDADCHLAIDAERALLAGLEGGCQVPIGVYAKIKGNSISIKAGLFSLDGKHAVRDEIMGLKKDAGSLGRQLAERILENEVARRILDEVKEGIRRSLW